MSRFGSGGWRSELTAAAPAAMAAAGSSSGRPTLKARTGSRLTGAGAPTAARPDNPGTRGGGVAGGARRDRDQSDQREDEGGCGQVAQVQGAVRHGERVPPVGVVDLL